MGEAESDEIVERWITRRRTEGPRVTLVELYAEVAGARGLAPHELPVDERNELARRVMGAIQSGHEMIPGSQRLSTPVVVVDYDAAWPARYEELRARLAAGLAAARIEHVGSTSVPDLAAKPIIDIQVSVPDIADEAAYVSAIEVIGVQFRTRDDVHRYFRPAPPQPRFAHVHVCEIGSEWERDHLLYRDYLRTHEDARAAYAAMKRDAAAVWRDDSMGYNETKTALILDLMGQAEIWANETGWARE